MLQRAKLWELERKLNKEKISIYDLCRESNRFVTFLNSIEINDNFFVKLHFIKKAESSLKTLMAMLISKLNPTLNKYIRWDENKNRNYATLVLRLDKLNSGIGEARKNLPLNIKNITDVKTNVLTNNLNISSFVSVLETVFNDLIYNSLKESCQKITEQEINHIPDEDEKGAFYYEVKGQDKELLFYGLVYAFFLGVVQLTVPIFSDLKPVQSSIKTISPEAREYARLTAPQQSQNQETQSPHIESEVNTPSMSSQMGVDYGDNLEE